MKSTINQIIQTDTEAYEKYIVLWQVPLRNLENLVEVYKSFATYLGAFTEEAYLDIVTRAGNAIYANFVKGFENDAVSRLGETTAKILMGGSNLSETYQPLKAAITIFNRSLEPKFNEPVLNVEEITITDSKPVLKIESILKRYQYTLNSERQTAIYDAVLKAQKAYNEANTLLLTMAKPSEVPLLHNLYGLFSEDTEGFLSINPGHINRLN